MCGIHAVISKQSPASIEPNLERLLCRRGPDHTGSVAQQIPRQDDSHLHLAFTSTVLSLRGDHIAKQPLVDQETGSVLCWNGEAWRIRDQELRENDTEAVMQLLASASLNRQSGRHETASDPVLEALREIAGPFAFIYFDKPANRLYYGRDRLGRRSLLMKNGEHFVLSSIVETPSGEWTEVEADGCYSIQLDQDLSPVRHDWTSDDTMVSSIGVFNTALPDGPVQLCADSRSVSELHQQLSDSVRLRVRDVPLPPQATLSDARVAILFSGGLDCTVLARLASDTIPAEQPIDLLNVAFENPRVASNLKIQSVEDLYELCPDRITGRRAFAELTKVCPGRPWRFVTVNIPYQEYREHRAEVISLIYPHNTEMDLSIASALYFASRGTGIAISGPDAPPQAYTTTARVLLSGLGADELFGGYGRHRIAFSRGGYTGLVEELKLDVSRLGKRNLGRDDRVLSHWGRETRFAYLDEKLVRWAIELPAWEKCDFGADSPDTQPLDPEKRVLRLLARNLGLTSVAEEKKRAIQFGARTAKMESGKVKGTTSLTS